MALDQSIISKNVKFDFITPYTLNQWINDVFK